MLGLKYWVLLPAVFLLAACVPPTYAQIQSTPVQLSDGSLGYVYQGRANFPGQLEIADQSMQEHCRSKGRSQAVMLDRKMQDLGAVGFGNVYDSGYGVGVSATTISNQNQQILFRCV
jgi:hypothetical protein